MMEQEQGTINAKPVRYAHFQESRLTTIKDGRRVSRRIDTVAFGEKDEPEPSHLHPSLGSSDKYHNRYPAALQDLRVRGYVKENTFDYDKAARDALARQTSDEANT